MTGSTEEKVWFVCADGSAEIGPVSADQLARGLKAGVVPGHARVRHQRDVFWSDLLDAPEIVEALKAVSIESAPPPPPPSPALRAREYFVWVPGVDPIGPVSADQIARGIRAGKVPPDASVQRHGELFARDVLEEEEVIAALKAL